MKLRTQLLLLNLFSLALLLVALFFSYARMLLTLEQTRWLTAVAIVAAVLSSFFYWLMTSPIVRSIERLTRLTAQVGQRQFQPMEMEKLAPVEVHRLAEAFTRMGHSLEISFGQLEEMVRSRRALIASVSHDLRTPLMSIQSCVEALQDKIVIDPAAVSQYLTVIHTETRRLSVLIADLFELSRLELEPQIFTPVKSRMDQLILEVLDAHRVFLSAQSIQVHVDIPDDLPAVWMVPDKMHRVVSNLVQNAIRYSPAGTSLDFVVRLDGDKQEVEVALRDCGPGVAADEKERIFEQFYRTDRSRNRDSGGAGLGLAIARSLVEWHGGRIGTRDRLDGQPGSEFWFRLPVTR